ncbi:MAG: 3-isopropylmalate dehydrogenase [Fusobacteriaceae bacterium]|jgi:3-isopropylmalate dehydrogenase|nr:3-isopropylmalate dehydrogenase [Fusobacteriaceae bacterium]
MRKTIALIRGDGIGPEIVGEARRVLETVAEKYGREFIFTEVDGGGAAIERYGEPMPERSLEACLAADAVLLGALGHPKYDGVAPAIRPEKGLLKLRQALGLFANIRPAKLIPALKEASPLRADIRDRGIDFLIVRELIGGIYFGKRKTEEIDGVMTATDTLRYSKPEIERIARVAFELAAKRKRRVLSVDKENVLDSSKLWRKTVADVAAAYPGVALSHMLVDNAAMQIVKDPAQFDVVVTENMFGDILSDEASMITGSIGLIPSWSTGEGKRGLYEPIHGSAPDIAGKNLANPIGTILSAAQLLRHSLDLEEEARAVEAAVERVLAAGYRTADIAGPGEKYLACAEMGERIRREIS